MTIESIHVNDAFWIIYCRGKKMNGISILIIVDDYFNLVEGTIDQTADIPF